MVFKPKFFLDLSGSEGEPKPAVVAPVVAPVAAPAAKAPPAAAANAAKAPAAAPAAAAAAAAAASAAAPSLTTAEAMAAELAAEQANRPAPSLATFAPESVTAGGALPRRRRSGGANLAGFKAMASSMLRS